MLFKFSRGFGEKVPFRCESFLFGVSARAVHRTIFLVLYDLPTLPRLAAREADGANRVSFEQ